jgi:8-oxo-dGTP pyrophosphatase MutT (NUDIX family)
MVTHRADLSLTLVAVIQNDLVLPISVKGILGPPGEIVLLQNERDEWEFPGGRLESSDESPTACLGREISEELDLIVDVGLPVHTWHDEPLPGRNVLMIAYRCEVVGLWPERFWDSHEHSGVRLFNLDDLEAVALPQGYRDALTIAGLI